MTKAGVVIEFAQTSKYNNIRKMNVKKVNKWKLLVIKIWIKSGVSLKNTYIKYIE